MNTQAMDDDRTAPRWAALQPPVDRNGLAGAATVLGLIGSITSIVAVGGLLGVVGLILGIPALRTAKRTGVGRGQAVIGMVTSAVAIVVSVAVVISAVWFAHKTQNCYQFHKVQQWQQCVRHQFAGG